MRDREIYYAVLFNRVENYNSRMKYEILKKYGNFEDIFLNLREIETEYRKEFKINGVSYTGKKDVFKRAVMQEVDYYIKNSIGVIGINSDRYPESLKQLYDPPPIIMTRGNTQLLNNRFKVAVVGARRATNRGLTSAYSISKDLSENSVTVVSGMAMGVDSYAHRGALEAGGSTIAVMANGIDIAYPKRNIKLWNEVIEKGLVITEFPLSMPPYRFNFPRRNRIISGLSNAVLIVEAAEKSGALITSQYALEQGKDVMALPGEPNSTFYRGNNMLIKNGAFLVENAYDIFNILGKDFVALKKIDKFNFSQRESEILNIIGEDKIGLESLKKASNFNMSELLSTLVILELKGVIKQKPGKYFVRVR